ncbi:MAG TPA: hypothetical protein VFS66_07300 [Acidimicrobiia bacterium]|nr:hypothetical protein [Acidimicrobiia bacterium]
MDADAIAQEIVSIRSRLSLLGESESDERDALLDRLHSLQEQLVDPEPRKIERDEVEITHPVPPV